MRLLNLTLSALLLSFVGNTCAEESQTTYLQLNARVLSTTNVKVQSLGSSQILIESTNNFDNNEKQKIYVNDSNQKVISIDSQKIEEIKGLVRQSILLRYQDPSYSLENRPLVVNIAVN